MSSDIVTDEWQGFRESFQRFIVGDIEKALKASIEVGVILLTINAVECLSGYLVGQRSDETTFCTFIEVFMPKYKPHGCWMYKCVRNGLMHDYTVNLKKEDDQFHGFEFTRDKGERHLVPVEGKPGWMYMNRESLAEHFLDAQREYFKKAVNSRPTFTTRDRGVFTTHVRVMFTT
jgi:hypothetical protein